MKFLKSLLALALILCFSLGAPRVAAAENIVEIAASKDSFTTLVAAVEAADLVEALASDGSLTVFAPTNDAFAQLPAGTVETLLQPENKASLVKVLSYHVIPGAIFAADLKPGTAETLEGQSVTVTLGESVRINDATVVATDIQADNGVIHVIDRVLVPADL